MGRTGEDDRKAEVTELLPLIQAIFVTGATVAKTSHATWTSMSLLRASSLSSAPDRPWDYRQVTIPC